MNVIKVICTLYFPETKVWYRSKQAKHIDTADNRLATIQNKDRIVVVTKNGIAEQGNHDEWIEQDVIFTKLFQNKKDNGSIGDVN